MEGTSLIEKFNKVKMEFLDKQKRSESFEENSSSIKNPEMTENENLEKLNFYKDIITTKEEEKFILDQHKAEFFDFFEKHLSGFYDFKNLKEAKENLEILDKLLKENKKSFLNSLNPHKKNILLSQVSEIFANSNKYIDLDLDTKNYNESIRKLKYFTNEIKKFADEAKEKSQIIDFSDNENNLHSNNQDINMLARKRRNQLLSTAYIKKSQSKLGENDLVIPVGKLRDSNIKNKKMLLRNFLQIYLIKENVIFSESYFSKYDHAVLYKYRKYKFYQIKLCFSIHEPSDKLETHLDYVKKFFDQYLLMTRKEKRGNFTTFLICGVGKNQSTMKKSLIKYINNDINSDCLIKISLFSNLFDCIRHKLMQCMTSINYNYQCNIKEAVVNKILKKREYKKI